MRRILCQPALPVIVAVLLATGDHSLAAVEGDDTPSPQGPLIQATASPSAEAGVIHMTHGGVEATLAFVENVEGRIVIENMLEKHGGRARLSALTCVAEEGWFSLKGVKGTFVFFWTPQARRMELRLPNGTLVRVTSRQGPGWEMDLRGRITQTPVSHELPGHFVPLLATVASSESKALSHTLFELRHMVDVSLSEFGHIVTFWIRDVTFEIDRVILNEKILQGGDWRECGGVAYPCAWSAMEKKGWMMVEVEKVAVNEPFSENLFMAPLDVGGVALGSFKGLDLTKPPQNLGTAAGTFPLTISLWTPLNERRWLVPMGLQGFSYRGWMSVETGAEMTAIMPEMAPEGASRVTLREYRERKARKLKWVEGPDKPRVFLTIPQMRVGGLALSSWLMATKEGSLSSRSQGVLGADVFQRYLVKFDPRRRELTLYDRESRPSLDHVKWIPLEIHENRYYVEVSVNAREGLFLLDTGAESTHLFPAFTKKSRFRNEGWRRVLSSFMSGPAGFDPVRGTILSTLAVGPLVVVNPVIKTKVKDQAGEFGDGVLGRPFFQHAVTWWDAEERRFGMEPPPEGLTSDGSQRLNEAHENQWKVEDNPYAYEELLLTQAQVEGTPWETLQMSRRLRLRHPQNTALISHEINAMDQLGDQKEIEPVLLAALMENKNDPHVLRGLALYYCWAGKHKQAVEYAGQALKNGFEGDREILQVLVESNLLLKKREEALKAAKEGVEWYPWDPQWKARLDWFEKQPKR